MRRVLFAIFGALLILPMSLASVLAAQDATPAPPEGAPLTAVCNAPDIPPGTPTAMD